MGELPGRYIGEQPGLPPQQPQQPVTPPQQPNLINKLIQEERVSNFLTQTSPVSTLENLNYILKGQIYDNTAKEWIQISEGIPESIRLDFLQFITADLSEDVRMTNLDIKQINGIMEFVIEWIVDYLDIVADDKKLTEEQMTKIALIMIKAIYYTLLRAQSGIERSKMFGSLSIGADLNPQPQPSQQKKKAWQFWK
ncbi:hypothetical protein KAT51_06060 [bacterium]|nr:hypothetical protein [bacterium]